MPTMPMLTRKQSILAAAVIARRSKSQSYFLAPYKTSFLYPKPFAVRPSRHFASTNTDASIDLPSKTGSRNGLKRHTILADDSHPLRIYSRIPSSSTASFLSPQTERSILLLHGRTWSSQPVFDLRTSEDDQKKQSVLQSLCDLGFKTYALDLRGFGETPRDTDKSGGYTTPARCVKDVKCAIDWIASRHCIGDNTDSSTNHDSYSTYDNPTIVNTKPALLGWSQGALVAQLYAQQHPYTISDLVLFGSIYDPRVIYPRKPLYDPSGKPIWSSPENKPPAPEVANTDISALEDFTLPGTICDEAALAFSSLALTVDPVKVAWDDLHEFNVANPALIRVPTMVICGSQDPYVSWEAQRELYERLGTEDKVWCVLPGCDHAAHILKARKMFLRSVVGFLLRKEGY